MSDTCPTVKIVAENEQGYVVINEDDFDEETQVLFEEPTVEGQPAAPRAPRKRR